MPITPWALFPPTGQQAWSLEGPFFSAQICLEMMLGIPPIFPEVSFDCVRPSSVLTTVDLSLPTFEARMPLS